jgi:protease-4
MSLTPDQILDRIKLKKQIVNWRFAAVIAVLMLFLSLFATSDSKYGGKGSVIDISYIARVYVSGAIFDDAERLEILKEIEDDSAIKAVIVHIDSPGGTVVGGENLHNAFRRISGKKPTVTVMGDVAASAAYMTAIGTDRLIAHNGTVTGSIGALAQAFEVTDLAEKVGIKFNTFKSSPLKGGPLPTEKVTPEMAKSMQDTIDDIYEMFYDMVKSRRNIPVKQLDMIADGRTFTGRQAIKLGLVDEIGDEETALNWLQINKKVSKSLKVRTIPLNKERDNFYKLLEYSNSLLAMISNIAKGGKIIFF